MITTAAQLLELARSEVVEITPSGQEPHRRLIDVREQHEYDAGHIPGAMHMSRGLLETLVEQHIPDHAMPLTLYCAAGARSLLAAKTLRDMGYTDVVTMSGGFEDWTRLGFPVETGAETGLTAAQRARYARHLQLPEVGEAGQLRLLAARVLVIGAGGLGSPAALYLAAAGVGTIGISDFDTVDVGNLQRQILHNETRVGIAKTDSARATLNALNSEVSVRIHPEPLNSENCADLFADYDIIVNGCDNFATRYLANDVAIFDRKPLVDGSVNRFTGEVTVVAPGASACYRCRYPEPPEPADAPSCSDAGVFGVLPGIIGSIQAVETIKLILDRGTSLAGRLLRLDALTMTFTEYSVPRDPACPVCGDFPSVTAPIDYVEFCAGATA